MMVEPDVRETLYYDLNNVLMAEPDHIPHYYTILLDKFKILIMGMETYPIGICEECGSTDHYSYKGQRYCHTNNVPDYRFTKEGPVITGTKAIDPSAEHTIRDQLVLAYIHKVIMDVLTKLAEGDSMMTLYTLEGYLFRADNDDYFETTQGDIRKAHVQRELYRIKRAIVGYMGLVRQDIRFMAQMRTPNIRI
jgi:hypothetical protein